MPQTAHGRDGLSEHPTTRTGTVNPENMLDITIRLRLH